MGQAIWKRHAAISIGLLTVIAVGLVAVEAVAPLAVSLLVKMNLSLNLVALIYALYSLKVVSDPKALRRIINRAILGDKKE